MLFPFLSHSLNNTNYHMLNYDNNSNIVCRIAVVYTQPAVSKEIALQFEGRKLFNSNLIIYNNCSAYTCMNTEYMNTMATLAEFLKTVRLCYSFALSSQGATGIIWLFTIYIFFQLSKLRPSSPSNFQNRNELYRAKQINECTFCSFQ